MSWALSRSAVARTGGLFLLWLILTADNDADLGAAAGAVLAATLASLRLLPPGTNHVRPIAVAQLALRFLRQ